MQNRNKKGSLVSRDAALHLPRLMDFKIESAPRGGHASHQEDPYIMEQDYKDMHSQGHIEEKVQITITTNHKERDGCRQGRGDPNYCTNYEDRDEQRVVEFEPHIPKCESRSEMPRGRSHSYSREDSCIEEATYRRGYPETDPLDSFHTEEIRIDQGRSPDYKLLYPNDNTHHWSWDRRQGSREPESTRRSFLRGVEQSHGLLINAQLIEDHNVGEPYIKEAKSGPSRTGLSNSERKNVVPRFMSEIPEPFKRFLKGGTNSEQERRKRSRFSDASIEEEAKTRRM